MLGTTIGNSELVSKETKRISKVNERAALIDILPVAEAKQSFYKRSVAMSMLPYGWVLRAPMRKTLDQCGKAMVGKGAKNGNRRLKNVMEGGASHPVPVLTSELVNLTLTVKQGTINDEAFEWKSAPLCSVAQLQKRMRTFDWKEDWPFTWVHHGLQKIICLQKLEATTPEELQTKLAKKRPEMRTGYATLSECRSGMLFGRGAAGTIPSP